MHSSRSARSTIRRKKPSRSQGGGIDTHKGKGTHFVPSAKEAMPPRTPPESGPRCAASRRLLRKPHAVRPRRSWKLQSDEEEEIEEDEEAEVEVDEADDDDE